MGPDRRIDATARLVLLENCVVQCLTHAVKPLKFIGCWVRTDLKYGSNRMRIVRRKLGIDAVRHPQKLFGTTNIGHICRGFLCENGEATEAFHLRAFDFSVPIGTLHKPHHNLTVQLRC